MKNYQDYVNHLSKIADISNSIAVLSWDQEVMMPPKGAEKRAQQISTLAGIHHELSAQEDFGTLLKKLSEDDTLTDEQKRNVTVSLKEFERNQKYSTAFVQEMSKSISQAFQAWNKAKKEDDFSIFQPFLEKLVALKREECELLGYKDHPYDALIDQYEPETTVAELDVLFEDVKNQLVEFVQEIAAATQNEDALMRQHYPKDKQLLFTEHILAKMGYDFDAGRQDISSHPFSTSFSSEDSRVTTRVSESDLSEILWSSIHEGGHALYEQGLKIENYGLPSGTYLSLGIHESQSRLWENNVGRSLSFWNYFYPKLQEIFPDNLKNYTVGDFYKAMNIVQPSLIRTNADELTYHFHVLIRYEIEKELIAGTIEVVDLPEVWNNKYKAYLNIDVPSDAKGVLQDIHWSHGSFGYFPTYSLGSFYAAQFFNKAEEQIEQLDEKIKQGDFSELLDWLRTNIHQYGRLYTAAELCEKVTGEKLNFAYFMRYAKEKYAQLYQLKRSASLINQATIYK